MWHLKRVIAAYPDDIRVNYALHRLKLPAADRGDGLVFADALAAFPGLSFSFASR